jgi:ubiquinone/menaquinone biosynthesis C-methylase UbiE
MNLTRNFFDEKAKDWDKNHGNNLSKSNLENLVGLLNIFEGSRVVDLGCGTGILVPYLLDKVNATGTIYAVDPSKKMLYELSKKFQRDNIKTVAINAEELSKIDDVVDAIVCFSAFPHIENKEKAIEEIAKILKKDGRFLIAHFSSRDEINSFHSKLQSPICHHILPDKNEMEKLMNDFGFRITRFIDEHSRYELLALKK